MSVKHLRNIISSSLEPSNSTSPPVPIMSLGIVPRFLSDTNSLAGDEKPRVIVPEIPISVPRTHFFAPPSYVESVLLQLTSRTGQVIETLDTFLALPFTDSLKVSNRYGADINLRTTVLAMKNKYETLQQESLVPIQDLSTYATMQQHAIPKLDVDGSEPYISTSTMLVLNFQAASRDIAAHTATITAEFTEFIDVLGANLASVIDRVTHLEAEIRDNQQQHSTAKLATILTDVFRIVLSDLGTAVVLAGLAHVVPKLSFSGAPSFALLVQHAVKVHRLEDVIAMLKSVLNTCLKTKESLQKMIPLMEEVVKLMGGIVNVWDEVKVNLEELTENSAVWFSPRMMDAEALKLAAKRWAGIVDNCAEYVNVVNGYTPGGDALKRP